MKEMIMPGIMSEGVARGSAPMYGARRGIRCRLPGAWDREPTRASRQRWCGRAPAGSGPGLTRRFSRSKTAVDSSRHGDIRGVILERLFNKHNIVMLDGYLL